MSDPRELLKDVGYVAVGFGVIAFQKAQVRRRELEQQLGGVGQLVEERAGALGEQLERTFEVAVGAARDAAGQVLDVVRPAS